MRPTVAPVRRGRRVRPSSMSTPTSVRAPSLPPATPRPPRRGRTAPAAPPPADATRLLRRHPANPLLKVEDHPGIAQLYNPAPVWHDGRVILLVSVVTFRGGNGIDSGETRVAESADGIHFTLRDEPFVVLPVDRFPYTLVNRHLIDSRVTRLDDAWYIVTPVLTEHHDGPCAVLGRTTDFRRYEVIDVISQPRNRGASLFPERIGGRYCKIDRPGGGPNSTCTLWLSYSPDLVHWGSFRPLAYPGYQYWNANRLGPTPPIRTAEGWLVIVHGQWGPPGGKQYYIGALLLDLEDPARLVGRTSSYLLAPQEPYERHGNCDNTVFPCGAFVKPGTDELWLYYGAADSCIGLATGSLRAVVEACRRGI